MQPQKFMLAKLTARNKHFKLSTTNKGTSKQSVRIKSSQNRSIPRRPRNLLGHGQTYYNERVGCYKTFVQQC